MNRVPVGTLTAAVLALGLGTLSLPLQATTAMAAVATPAQFTSVSSSPGDHPGEVTISWDHTGASTTSYVIETGLTSFSPSADSTLPTHGRGWKEFSVPVSQRSVTLTAAQVASAGASVGSANHLYFRIRAVNHTSAGDAIHWYPYLQTVAVQPAVPAASGTRLRMGTFNVRTAHATTDERSWLERAPDVARTIVSHHLGVVALQELGPGRADGQTGTTAGTPRQTDSLLTALAANDGDEYRLVRTTSYVKSGTISDTQGMRILYDASRYSLVSDCPDTSSDGSYNASCSVRLPLRNSGDTEANRRRAAYAEFAVRASGEHFFVVSVHLDARHATDVATEQTYDALRGAQAEAAINAVDDVNPNHYPVVLGGDLNTWQNNKVGYTAHDNLVDAGFYDTAAATQQVNLRYTTLNDFAPTMPDPGTGYGARLDALMVKGVTGADYWENVMKVDDPARPSDHDLVLADIRLPDGAPVVDTPAYRPVTPTRLLDTSGAGGALPAGGTLDLQVTGRAGVPADGVSAVVLNVTSTAAAAGGFATAYPAGAARTSASTLNYATGQAMANSVVVKVGAGGKVTLYSSASSQLMVDVQGYFLDASDYSPLTPTRVMDTRDGTGAPAGQVGARESVELTVTGRGGVPASGVSAVVLNLTATQADANGYLTAYPAGVARTSASSLNFTPGQSTANGVIVKVGTGGKVVLYVSAGTHVIADVQGWFASGSDLTTLTPNRILDTRDGTGATATPVAAGGKVDVVVTGRGGVPATGVTAVVLNVTATRSGADGYATAYATGDSRTSATNLAFTPGRSIANRVIVKVGDGGRASLYASASTDLIADVVGYVS